MINLVIILFWVIVWCVSIGLLVILLMVYMLCIEVWYWLLMVIKGLFIFRFSLEMVMLLVIGFWLMVMRIFLVWMVFWMLLGFWIIKFVFLSLRVLWLVLMLILRVFSEVRIGLVRVVLYWGKIWLVVLIIVMWDFSLVSVVFSFRLM